MVDEIKGLITTSDTTVSYTTIEKNISTTVSRLPEYIAKNRNISELFTNHSSVIYNNNESINTRSHQNWNELNIWERKLVNDTRSRKNCGCQWRIYGRDDREKFLQRGESTLFKLQQQSLNKVCYIVALTLNKVEQVVMIMIIKGMLYFGNKQRRNKRSKHEPLVECMNDYNGIFYTEINAIILDLRLPYILSLSYNLKGFH